MAETPAHSARIAVLTAALLVPAFVWAYWPTWLQLINTWNTVPDYSHGFLVLPFALFCMWARADLYPGCRNEYNWLGLGLIGAAGAARYYGALYYIDAIDGWSMIVWLTGLALLAGGWSFCRWCLPSLAFLVFLVPLPYQMERWLSVPLQKVATKLSCWAFQFLGQPALSEGNTILLGDHHLEVEQACSGLRILVGIAAIAAAFLIITRRPLWEKCILTLAVVPVALLANATRIVLTGFLYQYASDDWAKSFSHDLAGWVMIPIAIGLFAAVLGYLNLLIREEELVDVGDIVRSGRSSK